MSDTPIRRAFLDVSRLVRPLLDATDERVDVVVGTPPDDGASRCRIPAAAKAAADPLTERLAILDGLMPMVRDPARGTWEMLEFTVAAGRSNAYLSVMDAVGPVSVAVFGANAECAYDFDAWCRTRTEGVDLGTGWDGARKGRPRNSPEAGSLLDRIDPGVYQVIDLVTGLGARTLTSCEGHPDGAYLGYHGGDPVIGRTFARHGWTMEGHCGGHLSRMPAVAGVADRDDRWRRLCADLEAETARIRSPLVASSILRGTRP